MPATPATDCSASLECKLTVMLLISPIMHLDHIALKHYWRNKASSHIKICAERTGCYTVWIEYVLCPELPAGLTLTWNTWILILRISFLAKYELVLCKKT